MRLDNSLINLVNDLISAYKLKAFSGLNRWRVFSILLIFILSALSPYLFARIVERSISCTISLECAIGSLYGVNVIILLIMSILTIKVFDYVLRYVIEYSFTDIGQYVSNNMRKRALASLDELDIDAIRNIGTGNIINTAIKDIDILSGFLTVHSPNIILTLAGIIGTAIALFSLNDIIFLIISVQIAICFYILSKMRKRLSDLYDGKRIAESELSEAIIETKNLNLDLRIFQSYNLNSRKKISDSSQKILAFDNMINRQDYMVNIMTYCLEYGPIAFIITTLYFFVDRVSTSVTLAIIATLVSTANQLKSFEGILSTLLNFSMSLRRLKNIDIFNNFNLGEHLKIKELSVVATNLSIHRGHDGSSTVFYPDFSLYAGDRIAISGPSGSGKSSLFDCLMGLVKEYEGSIQISGHEVKHYSKNQLRKIVCVIAQQNIIPEADIISYLDLDDDSLCLSYRTAVRHFKLEHKLDYLREDYEYTGMDVNLFLSENEKKILTLIKHSLNEDLCVLLLDEVNADFDSETEKIFIDYLSNINAIILITAHRQSIFASCNISLSLGVQKISI